MTAFASAQDPDPVPDAERPPVADPPGTQPRVVPGPAALGTVTGTIVDLERATGRMTVVVEGDKKATLMVPKDAVVKLNGKPSNLSQLRINDTVRITVTGARPNVAREIVAARVDPAEPDSQKDVQVVEGTPSDERGRNAGEMAPTLGLTVVSSNRAFSGETRQQTLSGASETIGGTTPGTTGGTNQPIGGANQGTTGGTNQGTTGGSNPGTTGNQGPTGGTNQGTNQSGGGTTQGPAGGTNQTLAGASQTIGGTTTTQETTGTDARESLTIMAVTQGGPGAEAGLRVGDFIVAIDGRRPPAANQRTELIQLLPSKEVGDTVVLDIMRGQARSRVTLTVEAAQPQTTNDQAPAGVDDPNSPRTGTQTGTVPNNTGVAPNTGLFPNTVVLPNTGGTAPATNNGTNQGSTVELLAQQVNQLRAELEQLRNRVDQLEQGRNPIPQQQQGTQNQTPQNQERQ
ncbi:MAG: PDZ domain-containing protein [Planctomycetaceae bacterium]